VAIAHNVTPAINVPSLSALLYSWLRYRIHSITASLLSPFSSIALLPSLLLLPALCRLLFLPALCRHHNHVSDPSTVSDIIKALGEKLEPISGQPSYDQLFAIRGAITHVLYPVPFDEELGDHNLCGIIMDPSTYKNRFSKDFPKYSAPKAFTDDMEEPDEVKRAKANIVNKAKKTDWKTFSAASNAVRTLLLDLVDKTWLVELEDEDEVSGFAEVAPDEFFTHLLANCTGRRCR